VRNRPILVALAASLAVAGLSFLLEPFALLPDPWAWIVWGDELLRFDLDTTSGPSWKPLPVFIVAALSVAGDAAPILWDLVARAGCLLAFFFAWRVARRLGGTAWAGWIAVAALAICLLPSWMNIVAMGREEGLLCALILWSIDRHQERREGQAFAVLFLAALLRPEVWPFLGLYGLWLLWRRPGTRIEVVVLGLLLLPLWFLPDIVTVGDPLQSSQKAQGGISGTTLTEPVKRAFELVPISLQLLALAAAVLAILRLRGQGWRFERPKLRGPAPEAPARGEWRPGERELQVLALFASALVWVALVAVTSKVANYAGIARFQHPAAALFAVLAGVGAVWLATLLADRLGRRELAYAGLAVVVLVALVPSLPQRARRIDRVVKEVQARSTLDTSLGDAVDAAGGRGKVVACGATFTIAGNEPQLAWRLQRHIDQVDSDTPRAPGAVFRVDSQALSEPKVRRLGIRLYAVKDRTFDPVAEAGVWEVLEACAPATSR
jgi:hypothetical protein